MSDPPDEIPVTVNGGTLPVVELLTGRGFITGKSGSGKSMTASVIAEELLEHDLGFLIVDTDGEYYGLKEQYEVLHVGADEACDAQVGIDHAELLATMALEEDIPIVLDVSGFLDESRVDDLLERVVRELFVREKKLKKPFLLFVEEAHEYLPESGGLDDLGERLLQVAKRGRKRGLGICAISQRPAAVTKEYITQCNWIVWHRLTWNNDTAVVQRIIDAEAAEAVEDLANGEAILMTDWDEQVRRVKFRMRKTVDVGQTPDFSESSIPDLRPVDHSLVERLEAVGTLRDEPRDEGASTAASESTADAASTSGGEASTGQADETGADSGSTSRASAASSNGSAKKSRPETSERENMLLELGDLMVYLFATLHSRGASATRSLRQRITDSSRAGDQRRGTDQTQRRRNRLLYALLLCLCLVVLVLLFV